MPTSFSGAVLCGGASRRMGEDKAWLEVDGVPMAVRVARGLRAAGAAEVVAVGGDPRRLQGAGLEVVPDDEPGGGPLPATLTALRRATHAVVVVLACDLVDPSPAAVTALLDALDAAGPAALGAVPVVGGHHQWTHAAWRTRALPALQSAQRAGAGSLRRAARDLAVTPVHGLDPAAVLDADTPGELEAARRRSGTAAGSLRSMDVPEIDVERLVGEVAAGAPLIDVRREEEHAEARVSGAQLIPLGDLVERIEEVPEDGTVYVICATGARSARAAQHLRGLGIDAVNVAGGIVRWIDAGLPVDRGAESEAGGA